MCVPGQDAPGERWGWGSTCGAARSLLDASGAEPRLPEPLQSEERDDDGDDREERPRDHEIEDGLRGGAAGLRIRPQMALTFPDFTKLPLGEAQAKADVKAWEALAGAGAAKMWDTPEGVAVKIIANSLDPTTRRGTRVLLLRLPPGASLREAALDSGCVTAEQFEQWVRPQDMVGTR